MRKPKMIIFDAGKTLFDNLDIDTLRGVKAYMPYLTANPKKLTAEEIDKEVNTVFETFEACREQLFEVHEQTVLKLAFDLLELEFSIPIAEIEQIIWENDSKIVPVAGAKELLTFLNEEGVRTSVISNNIFSGYLLKERMQEIYPHNQFEFVIASSDYGIRKPARYLFEAGIVKSGLTAGDIWYVGDKIKVDVKGSIDCGITPILYKSEFNTYDEIPADIITIENYNQLIQFLKNCDPLPSS